MSAKSRDIFGAVRMAYVVVGSRKIKEWKRFGVEALGLHLASESANELAFRIDEHARRLIIEKDDAEDVVAVGWQLNDDAVLQTVLDRLAARQLDVELVDDQRAQQRGVESFHRFIGPKEFSIELFTRPILDNSTLNMLGSGFNTGTAGMGHMAIASREPERMLEFWQEVFDARISDRIEQVMGRAVLDVVFLRVNERHHSIAIASTRGLHMDPFPTRIQHFNIEAATLDDLSAAYVRCESMGYKIAHSIGQHPNDRELSFYVHTPSGFELELGWDALAVDEETWQEDRVYPNISLWGHNTPGQGHGLNLSSLKQGVLSLLKKEFYPW